MATCAVMLAIDCQRAAAQVPLELHSQDRLSESSLNVCKDTPLGTIKRGGDITQALQWACDHVHEHRQAVFIPAGEWVLSDTVTTPYRSGFTLLGAGITHPRTNAVLAGTGTILKWAGEEGGIMLRDISTHARIGNFAMDGQRKAGVGLLVDYPEDKKGLGTGKSIIEPLQCFRLKYGVQVGVDNGTRNCDNLTFEWLECENCEAAYHGANVMGMDIIINRLSNYQNKFGVLMDGGGQMWVQSSLTTNASTLLKINDTSGFGPNNAYFRFSQTKVDAQARDGFTLVDCDSAAEIRMLFDGGIQSNTRFEGTFAKLTGSNFLHITDFSSTFNKIEVTRQSGWGTPVVLIEACRIWGKRDLAELFAGAVNVRVVHCTRTNGTWLDWDSQQQVEPGQEP